MQPLNHDHTNGTGIKQWFINAFNLKKRATADQDTEEQIAEIDEALSDLAKGMPYGWATITTLVRGLDEEELNSRARQLAKDLADIGYGARIEDAMAVEAIKEPGLVRQPRTNDGQSSAAPPGRPGRVAQRPS